MRLIVRAGRGARSARESRARRSRRVAARSGHDDEDRRSEMNDAIDFIGGAMGAGAGTDLTLRQHGRDEGQLRDRPAACCPTWRGIRRSRRRRSSGSASRRCRALQVSFEDPEFVADAVFDRLVYGFHPYGLPAERHAGDARRRSRATISSRSIAQHFVPNNAILAIVGDVTADGGVRRREEGLRRLGAARRAAADVRRAARSRPGASIVDQQAGRGADRSARRAPRHPAQHTGLHGAEPGASAFSAAKAQPAAPGAADRARPDLRRAGRHGHAAGDAATSRRNQHAIRGDRRSAAAHRRRVLAAAARARRRARARGREGVHDRQLSADDRDARRDRDAGAQRPLLRAAGRAAADVPRARQRGAARTTSSASRALICKPDRLSVVLVGNAAAFVSQLRGLGFGTFEVDRDGRSRSDGREFQAGGRRAGRCAAGVRPVAARRDSAGARAQTRLSAVQTQQSHGSHCAEEGAERARAARPGDRRQGRPRTAARRQEHHGRRRRPPAVGRTRSSGTVETVTYLEYPNHVRVETKIAARRRSVQVFDGRARG